MTIHLDTLINCPCMLPLVAAALWEEFKVAYSSYFSFTIPKDVEAYLRSIHMESDSDPLSTVVVHNGAGTLIGFSNITPDNMGSPWNKSITFTPWLANVWVAPQFRSQGIGDIMMTYMRKNVIHTSGTPVYLWTHTPKLRDWYAKRHGFSLVQTVKRYANYPEIYIMKYI